MSVVVSGRCNNRHVRHSVNWEAACVGGSKWPV